MDKADPAFYRNDFCRIFTHVEINYSPRRSQNISEGTRGFDNCIGAFVGESRNPESYIHFGKIPVEGDKLDLCIVSNPHPGSVGDNKFGPTPITCIKRVTFNERCILDHSYPVILLRHITEQIPFNIIDPTYRDSRCICS